MAPSSSQSDSLSHRAVGLLFDGDEGDARHAARIRRHMRFAAGFHVFGPNANEQSEERSWGGGRGGGGEEEEREMEEWEVEERKERKAKERRRARRAEEGPSAVSTSAAMRRRQQQRRTTNSNIVNMDEDEEEDDIDEDDVVPAVGAARLGTDESSTSSGSFASSSSSSMYIDEEEDVASSAASSGHGDEQQCWICWLGEGDKGEPLIRSPCRCTGSMQYVHRACLVTNERHRDARARGNCPVCKAPYDETADIRFDVELEGDGPDGPLTPEQAARAEAELERAVFATFLRDLVAPPDGREPSSFGNVHKIYASLPFRMASVVMALLLLGFTWYNWFEPADRYDFRCYAYRKAIESRWYSLDGQYLFLLALTCITAAVGVVHAVALPHPLESMWDDERVARGFHSRVFFVCLTLAMTRQSSMVPRVPFLVLFATFIFAVYRFSHVLYFVRVITLSRPLASIRRTLRILVLLALFGFHVDLQASAFVRGKWGSVDNACGLDYLDALSVDELQIPNDPMHVVFVVCLFGGEVFYRISLIPYILHLRSARGYVSTRLHSLIVGFFQVRDLISIAIMFFYETGTVVIFPQAFYVSVVIGTIQSIWLFRESHMRRRNLHMQLEALARSALPALPTIPRQSSRRRTALRDRRQRAIQRQRVEGDYNGPPPSRARRDRRGRHSRHRTRQLGHAQ